MVFTLKKQRVCAKYLLKGQWMLNCPSLHQSTVRLTSTDLQLCVNVSSLITAALRSLRGVCSESAGVCRRAVSALWSFPSWERAWERSSAAHGVTRGSQSPVVRWSSDTCHLIGSVLALQSGVICHQWGLLSVTTMALFGWFYCNSSTWQSQEVIKSIYIFKASKQSNK